MSTIENLNNVEWFYVFVGIVTFFVALKYIIELVKWFLNLFGIETKNMRQKREEHELLMKTSENLAKLQEKHNSDNSKCVKHDEEIRSDLKKLTDMFIDKEIDDYRWEIINFATKVSEGRPCNRDSFKHCIRTYEKYEKLLEENGLENGEVEISMEIVNEAYKKKMLEGF